MKKLLLVLFAVASVQIVLSQNTFSFSAAGKDLRIEFCTPSMFRVRVSWNKMFEAPEPWMVVKYNWSPINIKRTDKGDNIQLQTQQLIVNISKSTLKIDVLDKQNHILSSEKSTSK